MATANSPKENMCNCDDGNTRKAVSQAHLMRFIHYRAALLDKLIVAREEYKKDKKVIIDS